MQLVEIRGDIVRHLLSRLSLAQTGKVESDGAYLPHSIMHHDCRSTTKKERISFMRNQLYGNGWVEFASLKEVICQNWVLAESDRKDAFDMPAWSLGDFFLDMLKPGEVTFVTGLNGSGMTSVTLNTALAFAMQRSGTVVIHSLDQHSKYLAARLLNSAFGIPLPSLIGTESGCACLPVYVERLLQFDISIDGRLYESTEVIEASYEAMEALGLMVVNDMNHFPFGIAKREITTFLKVMAQSLEVPVLVASATMMLDIRKQDISWRDLDAVISLYREFKWLGHRGYEFNEDEDAACKIRLLKNRYGPTGTMPVKLSREHLRFEKDGELAPRAFDPCA